MKCEIKQCLGVCYAFLSINGVEGGYIGKGRTNSEALRNVFEIYYKDNE